MGYYTQFTLKIEENGDESLIKEFTEGCENANWAIDEQGLTKEGTKWYSHEDDILGFSTKHPETLFLLEGEGEEATDIWKLYVKNGKKFYTKATFKFDEYSEDKLT